jgi:RNA polymerase sigma-70 factor, ECF subfamily
MFQAQRRKGRDMTVTVEVGRSEELEERFAREALPMVDELFRAARGYTKDRADAEDLVQEVLMRAFRSFGQFSEGTNIRAWLLRIMTNTWISRYRMRQRRPAELLIEQPTALESIPRTRLSAVASASAELVFIESLGDDEVRDAFCGLPESQRMVMYYVDVEGFRYAEAADVLDIPLGTVMSRLYRGRRALRALLVERAR